MEDYQEGADGSESQSLETSAVRIREEGSNQWCYVGGATEDVDESCSSHTLHVEDRCEIHHEVG